MNFSSHGTDVEKCIHAHFDGLTFLYIFIFIYVVAFHTFQWI